MRITKETIEHKVKCLSGLTGIEYAAYYANGLSALVIKFGTGRKNIVTCTSKKELAAAIDAAHLVAYYTKYTPSDANKYVPEER